MSRGGDSIMTKKMTIAQREALKKEVRAILDEWERNPKPLKLIFRYICPKNRKQITYRPKPEEVSTAPQLREQLTLCAGFSDHYSVSNSKGPEEETDPLLPKGADNNSDVGNYRLTPSEIDDLRENGEQISAQARGRFKHLFDE
jgi:hypothetical protein